MASKRYRLEWLKLLLGLVVLGSYLSWSVVERRLSVEAQEYKRLTAQTQIVDNYLNDQLAAISRVLNIVRNNIPDWRAANDSMAHANHEMEEYLKALTDVRNLSVYDRNGTVIASSQPELLHKNYQHRAYFQTTLNDPSPDTLHIGEPMLAVTGLYVFMVTKRIVDENGEFDGVVLASVDPLRFRTTLASVNYADDMWSALAHSKGKQLLMIPEQEGQRGKNLAQPGSFFTRHIESGRDTNLLTGTVYATGEKRVMALRTIRPSGLYLDEPLILAVGRDLDAVYKDWKRFALTRLIFFILISLVSCFLMYRVQRSKRRTEKAKRASAALIQQQNEQLNALNEELRKLAMHDALTGVANRRSFDERFELEWRRCRRETLPLAVVMIDIDYFKAFNDHYGHVIGDQCLQSVAQQLQQYSARGSDFVARFGGEEFICLLPNTDFDQAAQYAESLRLAIEQLNIPHASSEVSGRLTISLGFAVCIPGNDSASTELIVKADECLYRAKAGGRNQAVGVDGCGAPG
ncbi:sensor domain-containing diguanylate cyclase [Marinobacterium lutimaris]|uniref:diguanylate cyclase n=1 Tax=Marinobacterium lutimaris TaxID=568106 RepID=A0A1H5Y300_9GAMM|nr:sensor domain-containing diguanylate cyclase [Marinobacterium lutimaris]SEG18268.1 diguanylate cyclase (GGDEF) domain-containing protein [Marinobacterium lutimaris]